jgi:hypothetical protein
LGRVIAPRCHPFSAIAIGLLICSVSSAGSLCFMNRALIESHVALAERHVADSRERILLQKRILANLERSGHAHSLTANMARDLLKSLQAELAMHIADRDRLRSGKDRRSSRSARRRAPRSRRGRRKLLCFPDPSPARPRTGIDAVSAVLLCDGHTDHPSTGRCKAKWGEASEQNCTPQCAG